MVHIIWDWNGTLLDDTSAALRALNVMLERRGLPQITMDFYRDTFAFPARTYYERIGMPVTDAEWDALAKEYHDLYLSFPVQLNAEALAAVRFAAERGCKQSILSALRQDFLDAALKYYRLSSYMSFVYGTNNLDGASKLDRGRELISKLGDDTVVMIGDALHDKEVADELGASCILCGQGSHAAWRLAEVAPTAASLLDAVRMVLRT